MGDPFKIEIIRIGVTGLGAGLSKSYDIERPDPAIL
jgi:hypothetical protein